MYLEQRMRPFKPNEFNIAAGGILGTKQSWKVDRNLPIEEIWVKVGFVVSSGLTAAPATAQSNDAYDNILTILQRCQLQINDGRQPRFVVDCSGVGLLEYQMHTALNLDTATLNLLQLSQGTTLAAGAYYITYRIPLAHPEIGDPLRSRLYLPCHTYTQDPVLTLTFNSLAAMGLTVGAINNVFVKVMLVNRLPTIASEARLQATAPKDQVKGQPGYGYIPFDLLENIYNIGVGIGTEQKFDLPIPGEYTELIFRQYLGGANITRNVLDGTGVGNTVGTGFGSEQLWSLQTGGVNIRQWTWADLRDANDWNEPTNNITQASSPNFSGPVLANSNFQAASSTKLDFLLDGLSSDTGLDLSSLLNCNLERSLKMQVIGTPASVATNASTLYIIGRRLMGDLSAWQKVQ